MLNKDNITEVDVHAHALLCNTEIAAGGTVAKYKGMAETDRAGLKEEEEARSIIPQQFFPLNSSVLSLTQ